MDLNSIHLDAYETVSKVKYTYHKMIKNAFIFKRLGLWWMSSLHCTAPLFMETCQVFFGILASVIIKMFLREASGVSEIVKSDLQLNVLVFLISGS